MERIRCPMNMLLPIPFVMATLSKSVSTAVAGKVLVLVRWMCLGIGVNPWVGGVHYI
jgi:hypothetical protein